MDKYTTAFAEYMEFEIVEVGYFGMDDETQWQRENEEWMEQVGIESVGVYAVDKILNEWHEYDDLKYTTSWDWILKVWYKASTEIFGQPELTSKCAMTILDFNIKKTVENLYKLIKSQEHDKQH